MVAGSVLILTVIVGSGAGIDAWFLGFFAVMLACLLMAVGLALGVTHVVVLRRSGDGA